MQKGNKMATISLCIIAKDEESCIAYAINSVKGIVDEVVVLDTGSRDKTKDKAREAYPNAKIIDYKWPEDFSIARNESLKHVTGDWVLVLDADETIAERDCKKIKDLVEDKEVDGYMLIQRNYTNDDQKAFFQTTAKGYKEEREYKGFVPSPLVRLFRNKKEFKFRYAVHATIEKSIIENKGKIKHANIPIHHYGFDRQDNTHTQEQKRQKYMEILEKELKKNPEDIKQSFELALVYKNSKQAEKAKNMLQKVISMKPRFFKSYLIMGEILLDEKKIKEAVEYYEKSIKAKPNVIAYYNLAEIFIKSRNYDKAMNYLNMALNLNKNNDILEKKIRKKINDLRTNIRYSVSIG